MRQECFAKVLETLQLLVRQGLSRRGHDDSNSNFLQISNLRCLGDPLLAG